MKIEMDGLARRGVALACETIANQAIISQKTKGDGLNVRPND
jgi:hypothetical protein